MQQEVYNRMRGHCLVFKRSKSRLNYPRLKILGHIITSKGRAPDPYKIRAILDLAAVWLNIMLSISIVYLVFWLHFMVIVTSRMIGVMTYMALQSVS